MDKFELTVVIPARNEEFLGKTIEDILSHTTNRTQIIAVLDGYLPNPPLPLSERLTIIYNPIAKGQRAATNQAARLCDSKYVCKIDAHCAVSENFDTDMIEAMEKLGDNTTLIPVMRNLHVFDWVCENGHRRYQGRSGECQDCGRPTVKDIVWIPKKSPATHSFRFDKTLHFQYFSEYSKRPDVQKGILVNGEYDENYRETMSIQGSCFMITRDKYIELDICSEDFNSWGQQGVEVACKTWLSGGKVIVNMKTWYAHMFRTQGGDFGFPYSNPQDKVNENRELSRQLFQHNTWPLAIHKFKWLIDKFKPIPDWHIEGENQENASEIEYVDNISRGMIFYTPNDLDEKIAKPVRDRLINISNDKKIDIVSSSLKKMDFGIKNVYFPSLKKGYFAMYKQILGALENSKADIVFFTEHDVLYHSSHFDFVPEDKETFYYNQNVWFLRLPDGHALHYDVNQLSGLCVYRETALIHYREKFAEIERQYNQLSIDEFNSWIRFMGHEPFTHNRIQWKNNFKCETWKSEYPNIDIKHGANATGQRWRKDQYRNQNLLINWQETDETIDGWGITKELAESLQ